MPAQSKPSARMTASQPLVDWLQKGEVRMGRRGGASCPSSAPTGTAGRLLLRSHVIPIGGVHRDQPSEDPPMRLLKRHAVAPYVQLLRSLSSLQLLVWLHHRYYFTSTLFSSSPNQT
jgi:hypothetical protein